MCYELEHKCKYCKNMYVCNLSNNACPTINNDADARMCDNCKLELEEILRAEKRKIHREELLNILRYRNR
jgi:hypothetical protein